MKRTTTKIFATATFAFLSICLSPTTSSAQDDPLMQEYNELIESLRTSIQLSKEYGAHYFHDTAAAATGWQAKWQAEADKGAATQQKLSELCVKILVDRANPHPNILESCFVVFEINMREKEYENAWKIAQRLGELDSNDNEAKIRRLRAAFRTGRYKIAHEIIEQSPDTLDEVPEHEQEDFATLPELNKLLTKEVEMREQEAATDDLPRVEFDTTIGKLVFELFENEAPHTVGNFISLVEAGFYDGVVFHRVLKGSLAQGGGFTLQRPIGVDYRIVDEFENPNSRSHLRGALSMANKGGTPETAGCQFFVVLKSQPFLDGAHTVFGRLISDPVALDSFVPTVKIGKEKKEEPIMTAIPTLIKKARVIRSRDHDYVPKKIK